MRNTKPSHFHGNFWDIFYEMVNKETRAASTAASAFGGNCLLLSAERIFDILFFSGHEKHCLHTLRISLQDIYSDLRRWKINSSLWFYQKIIQELV